MMKSVPTKDASTVVYDRMATAGRRRQHQPLSITRSKRSVITMNAVALLSFVVIMIFATLPKYAISFSVIHGGRSRSEPGLLLQVGIRGDSIFEHRKVRGGRRWRSMTAGGLGACICSHTDLTLRINSSARHNVGTSSSSLICHRRGKNLSFPLQPADHSSSALGSSSRSNSDDRDSDNEEFTFDGSTANTLIFGQAALVPVAMGVAAVLGISNFGFGPLPTGPELTTTPMTSIIRGILLTAPLGGMVYVLDLIENRWNIRALQDVTKATNQSVLRVLGGKFLPIVGLLYATALGVAAGVGEELFFRGVIQYKLSCFFHDDMVALAVSSVIFGALHAVTPLYALLATLAGGYFGWIYQVSDNNLVVPIVTHAVYDIAALFYSHWTVSKMGLSEQRALDSWKSPSA